MGVGMRSDTPLGSNNRGSYQQHQKTLVSLLENMGIHQVLLPHIKWYYLTSSCTPWAPEHIYSFYKALSTTSYHMRFFVSSSTCLHGEAGLFPFDPLPESHHVINGHCCTLGQHHSVWLSCQEQCRGAQGQEGHRRDWRCSQAVPASLPSLWQTPELIQLIMREGPFGLLFLQASACGHLTPLFWTCPL